MSDNEYTAIIIGKIILAIIAIVVAIILFFYKIPVTLLNMGNEYLEHLNTMDEAAYNTEEEIIE